MLQLINSLFTFFILEKKTDLLLLWFYMKISWILTRLTNFHTYKESKEVCEVWRDSKPYYIALYTIKTVTYNQVTDCRLILKDLERYLRICEELP